MMCVECGKFGAGSLFLLAFHVALNQGDKIGLIFVYLAIVDILWAGFFVNNKKDNFGWLLFTTVKVV
jgi:hypothetical protein